MKTDDFIEDMKALCEQYFGYDNRKYTIAHKTETKLSEPGITHNIGITFSSGRY